MNFCPACGLSASIKVVFVFSSISHLGLRARTAEDVASICASSASAFLFIASRAAAASSADLLAVVAVNRASFNKMALNVCSWPSALFCNPSNTPSPNTPMPIRNQPKKAIFLILRSNLRRRSFDVQVNQANRLGHNSCKISGPSKTTPTATTNADINTQIKNSWLFLCSSSRMLLSSASIIPGGGTIIPSETDEDARATRWTIIWLRLLAALGIFCVVALGLCVLMYAAFSCHNPSRRK